jgi:GAF domain-containing protein
VYESVARQEILSQTLTCLIEMIERETPRLSACLVFNAVAGFEMPAASQVVVGRGGETMAAACLDLAVERASEAHASLETLQDLPSALRCAELDSGTSLWSLPLIGSAANLAAVGTLFLVRSGSSLATEAERAVAHLAAELGGFAISRAHVADLTQRQTLQDPLTGLPRMRIAT